MDLLGKDELYLIAVKLFSNKFDYLVNYEDNNFLRECNKIEEKNKLISYLNPKYLLNFCLVNKKIFSCLWERKEIWYYLFSLEKFDNYNKYPVIPIEIKERYIYFHKLNILKEKLNISNFEVDEIYKLNELTIDNESNVENQIYELHKYISILTNLEILDLSNNKLKTLPVEIEKLTNLKELTIDCNWFNTLPKEIGLLNNLEKLSFAINDIKEIPEEIKQLPKLKEINIHFNPLTHIDYTF